MPDAPNLPAGRPGTVYASSAWSCPSLPRRVGRTFEANQVGSLLFLSGTLPIVDRKLAYTGRLGDNLSVEQGREAARLSALNALALAQGYLGDLDRVKMLVKLTVLMVTTEEFNEHPSVGDGASNLFAQFFGPEQATSALSTACRACHWELQSWSMRSSRLKAQE